MKQHPQTDKTQQKWHLPIEIHKLPTEIRRTNRQKIPHWYKEHITINLK
jgi:hypothetical protein